MYTDLLQVLSHRENRRRFWTAAFLCFLAVWGLSAIEFYRQFRNSFTDLHIHAMIAADFRFDDLHSITSRLSYPVWHLAVAVLMRLGLHVGAAATLVTGLMKAASFLLMAVLLYAAAEKQPHRIGCSLTLALLLCVVTPIRIATVNPKVYQGIGSMTVWHNPTQQTVNVSMFLLLPWLSHCRSVFDEQQAQNVPCIRLPAWKAVVLGVLAFGSIACKPTLMQCVLPAAFVYFLLLLLRQPKHWRYYGQLILAFLPSVGYFLLSWLYYTGVVVEYTSGAVFAPDFAALLLKLRAVLMMGLCPMLCLFAIAKKRLCKDHMLMLSLLMVLFAAVEAAWFYETGMRSGHGNFTWALNSAMLMLWVSTLCAALREIPRLKADGEWNPVRRLCLLCGGAAGLWHVVSGIYYLIFLWQSGNSF